MKSTCYVYVMVFINGLVKIGIAGDPFKRYKRLVQDTPFKEDLVGLHFVPLRERIDARRFEKHLHTMFSDYNKDMGEPFQGYQEFFESTLPLDDVLDELYKGSFENTTGYMNPLLTIKELPHDLRVKISTYLRVSKVYNGRVTDKKLWVSRLKCLIANILSQGKIDYTFPQTLRSSKFLAGMSLLCKRLRVEDYENIRRIVDGYTLEVDVNKRKYSSFNNMPL